MITTNDSKSWPTSIYAGTETNMEVEQQCSVSAYRYKRTDGSKYDTVAISSSDYIEEGNSTGCGISSSSSYFFANDSRTYKILSKYVTYGGRQYSK